jgi:hypothetical protein
VARTRARRGATGRPAVAISICRLSDNERQPDDGHRVLGLLGARRWQALRSYRQDQPRFRRWPRCGTNDTRHPPGSGRMSRSRAAKRSWGSMRMSSSGDGTSRSCRRRGVGGTGGGACAGLGRRVLTAARSGSPGGTVAPHVLQVRPVRFTPSQTGQRQIELMAPLDPSLAAIASRRAHRLGWVQKPSDVAAPCAGPCLEERSVRAVARAPRAKDGSP